MGQILIVEDDPSFAEALAFTLGAEGHEVLVAADAERAAALAAACRPDVIVADWSLGNGPHGGDACRQVHRICPRSKAIIITGHQDVASQVSRSCRCVETVLLKPFHMEQIIAAVRRVLPAGIVLQPGAEQQSSVSV
jgi:DNA-binding NtrC family response regulator